MLTNRIQGFFEASEITNRFAPVAAFVPCPMFQTFSAVQQSQIQEVYRLAAEQTREQLQAIEYPQFSMN